MAAEECTATSVAPSSSPPTLHSHSWWDILHPAAPSNSLSSWPANNTTTWQHHHHQDPNSNSSNCDQEDGVSISTSLNTNASNHSGLTVDSSGRHQLVDQPVPQSNNFVGEHVSDNHIWSHVLSSVASSGDLRNCQDVGENLFEAISSKTTSTPGIFEPACDYLKKIDTNNWEFPNPSSVFNNFVKNLNGYTGDHDNHQSSIESSERLTKLSNLVSNWSIAPPDPEVSNPQANPKICGQHISLTPPSSVENYSQQPAFCGTATMKNPVFLSCYGHHADHHVVKMEADNLDVEAPTNYYRRAFKGSNHSNGYHHHDSFINNSSMEADNFYGASMSHSSSTSTVTNYCRLSKPLIDIHVANKPCFRPLTNSFSDCKKQGLQAAATSLQTRSNNGRTQGISGEGKKKRGEETSSDTVLKKPKQESSTASSVKVQAPKVKLGDRITALQQIVSPFGKTDTASVLLEAIGYINFLQEQVQLLSNPYMKPNSHKQDPWGSLDGKDQKGGSKVDLRSRGLCLVPISCTPQAYHETVGSDYWTPAYRGCLYR